MKDWRVRETRNLPWINLVGKFFAERKTAQELRGKINWKKKPSTISFLQMLSCQEPNITQTQLRPQTCKKWHSSLALIIHLSARRPCLIQHASFGSLKAANFQFLKKRDISFPAMIPVGPPFPPLRPLREELLKVIAISSHSEAYQDDFRTSSPTPLPICRVFSLLFLITFVLLSSRIYHFSPGFPCVLSLPLFYGNVFISTKEFPSQIRIQNESA